MPSTSVLLLRHGQSEWNALGRWQGLADSPLTELGRSQATETARALVDIGGFDAVATSHLRRAHATACEIADRLGLDAPTVDRRWCEADAGEWQGLTMAEIEQRWPGWLSGRRRPNSFETAASVAARAADALGEIAERWPRGRVVVVTHSGIMRTLVRSAGVADERIPNLGGIWLEVDGSRSLTESPTGTIDRPGIDGSDHVSGGWRFVRRHEIAVGTTGVDIAGEDPGDGADHAEGQHGNQG